jgi:hypothetical protein
MHLALFKFKGMQETFSSQVVIETFFSLEITHVSDKPVASVWNP